MKLIEAIWRLFVARRGNVATSFALMTPIIIGAMAFGLEYGNAEYVRNNNQRISDAAAYAGALAYNATVNTTDMVNAAKRVGVLNGIPASKITVTLVASPADASRNAVQVTIDERVPLFFSKFFRGLRFGNGGDNGTNVAARGTAELISQTANCILAVDRNSTGIQLSGGTNITGNRCGVASNAQVQVRNCGSYIQGLAVSYGTTLDVPTNCGGNLPLRKADGSALTPNSRTAVDPYSGSTVVATAVGRITNAKAIAAPAAPSFAFQTTGTAIDFAYDTSNVGNTTSKTCASSTSTACQAWRVGCTATKPSAWVFNCPAGATVTLGNVTIGGGVAVTFNASGSSATTTINFANTLTGTDRLTFGPGIYTIRGNLIGGYGGISFNGNALNVTGFVSPGTSGTASFGAATYNVAAGVFLNGSVTATFGTGTYNIGPATVSCSGGNYSLCIQTSGGVTFTGPTIMNLSAGLRTGGGATVTIGSGSTANTFVFGPSSDGFAFRGDGGSKTVLASSATGGNVVQFGGHVNLTGGGSCLVVGEATHHDIKGNLWATGAMKLMPGQYTVVGTINFGGSGGGNSTCDGSNIGLYADGVTLVAAADASVSSSTGGDCSGTAFCISAGYSSVVLKPQASGGQAGFAVIGPQSASNTAGGVFTSGAANTTINGVFYLPNGPLTFSGGSRTGDAGGCLEVIGKSVAVSAGGLLGSNCLSTGGAQQTRVRVVQ